VAAGDGSRQVEPATGATVAQSQPGLAGYISP